MLVLLILFALPVLLVWGYLLFFQLQLRDRLYTQWIEKRQQLHGSGSVTTSRVFQRNQDALNNLLATVPTRSELPRILGQVTDYVAMHKATMKTLSYKPLPPSVTGLYRYNLVVSVTGNYEAIKLLLADLQNLNALAYVDSCGFINPDPQSDQLQMEARMVINLRSESTQ
ncbi:MAG: type 4a pilus biogenesis protein PilO [Geobacter sp.]|nr:type 4a pilus biogenesis protein PilO [Geobacter sp.]